ncbi:MAG: NAD(+) synthase [Actinobacteria bacterium]|nr:NAD(+) synthase [Actinomycetota bacterium]
MSPDLAKLLETDIESEYSRTVDFIKDTTHKYNFKGVALGLSGGIDSALTLKLSVDALGQKNVFGLIMPERDSEASSKIDAIAHATSLGIPYKIISMTGILRKLGTYSLVPGTFLVPRPYQKKYVRIARQKIEQEIGKKIYLANLENADHDYLSRSRAFYRSKHRLRMIITYMHAERRNFIVAATSNKSEVLTGFFVKYGDAAGDIAPIAHLYKTQVFELAKYVQLPAQIIKKAPSPDLIPGLTDEEAIGLSYLELDRILVGIENGMNDEDVSRKTGIDVEKIKYVNEIKQKSELLRSYPIMLTADR